MVPLSWQSRSPDISAVRLHPLQVSVMLLGVCAALYPVIYLPFQKANSSRAPAEPVQPGFSKKSMWTNIDQQQKSQKP